MKTLKGVYTKYRKVSFQIHFLIGNYIFIFPIFLPLGLIFNRTKAFSFDFIDKKLQKRAKEDCYK